MKLIQASRASAVLYNLLVARADPRPWLLPANICPIVPVTFCKARVPFEFVDISPDTLHMDLARAQELIKGCKFGGLLYAHTYGEISTPAGCFSAFKQLAPGLLIVDDRCLCIPDLEPAGCADVTLYSTGYAKIVELNSGGYAFLRDEIEYSPASLPFNPEALAAIEKTCRQVIRERKRWFYRDSDWLDLGAPAKTWPDYSLEIEKQRRVSLDHRALLNRVYQSRLPKEIQLPHNYQTWRFNIRVKNKARILEAIFKAGLFAGSHYASLAGIMTDSRAPFAEALAGEVINLFNDHHFDLQMAERTCALILENLKV